MAEVSEHSETALPRQASHASWHQLAAVGGDASFPRITRAAKG
jgi:hypothetical protein